MFQAVEDFLILPYHLVQLIFRLNIVTDVYKIGDLVEIYTDLPQFAVQSFNCVAELEHLYFR